MSVDAWAVIEDASLAHGFTQIPNGVTRNPNLSMQAKFLYGLLLSYAWQDSQTYPGLARLRADTGAKEDTLRRYIVELKEAGLIEVQRRGMGKTNRYVFKSLGAANNPPQKGGNKNTPDGGDHDPPQSGASRTPRVGGTTNTQGNEYAEDEDKETPSGDAEASTGPGDFVQYLREELDGADVPAQRGRLERYGKEVKEQLKKGVPGSTLYKALDRVVERWTGDDHRKLTLEQALEDVVNGRPPAHVQAATDGGPARATPQPALEALRAHAVLGKYAHLAAQWDFTESQSPPYKIEANLGGDQTERWRNADMMRSVARRAMRAERAEGAA